MMGALLRRHLQIPVVTTVHSDYRLDYLGRPLHRVTFGTINKIALRISIIISAFPIPWRGC